MKIAICPRCGERLVQDECFGSKFGDDFIENYFVGHCPTCKKKFKWVEVFDYIEVAEIEEVS